jgi:hypothetical protein
MEIEKMSYQTIQIDLGNSPLPNWRYVTGIDLRNDLWCSIYPSDNVSVDRLAECHAIYPDKTFRIVEVK